MFKVSEVAEMLSVEKVRIFEALIVHDTIMAPYITKERHLSYVTEVGVRKLEQLLFSNNFEEVLCLEAEEEIELNNDEVDSQDHMDLFIDKNELKKAELRKDIIEVKRMLTLLDKEIKTNNESISQYQNILSEDLKWTHNLMIDIESSVHDKEEIKQKFFSKMKKQWG